MGRGGWFAAAADSGERPKVPNSGPTAGMAAPMVLSLFLVVSVLLLTTSGVSARSLGAPCSRRPGGEGGDPYRDPLSQV